MRETPYTTRTAEARDDGQGIKVHGGILTKIGLLGRDVGVVRKAADAKHLRGH
jgi:hypothetical protein